MATEINAEIRTSFGKGAARQLRRDGRTPAVIYSRGQETIHISFDSHELFIATKGKAKPFLAVVLDGETTLVQVKEIQRNPLSRIIEHIDLVRVAEEA